MILHDRLTVNRTTTGQDADGNPITVVTTLGPFPAEVRPVNSDEMLSATADQVTTTYRMTVRAGLQILAGDTIGWRGTTYAVTGDLEQHTIGGRVHHQEALIRHYAG